jgi:hypothetical protein
MTKPLKPNTYLQLAEDLEQIIPAEGPGQARDEELEAVKAVLDDGIYTLDPFVKSLVRSRRGRCGPIRAGRLVRRAGRSLRCPVRASALHIPPVAGGGPRLGRVPRTGAIGEPHLLPARLRGVGGSSCPARHRYPEGQHLQAERKRRRHDDRLAPDRAQ